MSRAAIVRAAYAAAVKVEPAVRAHLATERDYWIAASWARLTGIAPASKLCALRLMGVINDNAKDQADAA